MRDHRDGLCVQWCGVHSCMAMVYPGYVVFLFLEVRRAHIVRRICTSLLVFAAVRFHAVNE
jgi:general stress protein CsbA